MIIRQPREEEHDRARLIIEFPNSRRVMCFRKPDGTEYTCMCNPAFPLKDFIDGKPDEKLVWSVRWWGERIDYDALLIEATCSSLALEQYQNYVVEQEKRAA